MRILLIVDSFSGGGAEAEVLALLETLVRERYTVALAYFNDGPLRPRFEATRVPLHKLSHRGLADPAILPRLVRLIRAFQPTLVHTHLSKSDTVGLITAWVMRVPVRVSTTHNVNPWREPWSGRLPWIVTLACAHRAIAVSPEVGDHLRRFANAPASKVRVIPNSVDVARFDARGRRRSSATEPALVGIVGRLVPEKGHSTFLEAARRVRARRSDIEFEIVGDGPLRAALERQTDDLGLRSCVRFTGFVDDIPAVMRRLDVLAMPSLFEGLPLALLEAMAAEVAVVAAPVGGVPHAVEHGRHGLLVPPRDPAALAEAILGLVESPRIAEALGREARARVLRDFDRSACHRRVLQLYSELALR